MGARSWKRWIVSLVALAAAGAAWAQDEALIEARHLEQVAHQPEEALVQYRAVVDDEACSSEARHEAVLGLVRCLLKTGRIEEASAVAERLPAALDASALVPKIHELLQLYAPSPVQELPGAHGARVKGLIAALGEGESEEVSQALLALGAMADPYLVAAVRSSTDPAVVNRAIDILAERVSDDHQATTALTFFAGLDPALEPYVTLKALEHLKVREEVPEHLWPMFDRCIESSLDQVHHHLISLMARRPDDKAADYLERMLDEEQHHKRVIESILNWRGGVSDRVGLAAVRHADARIRGLITKGVHSSDLPRVWLEACLSSDPEVCTQAFYQGAKDELPDQIGPTDRRQLADSLLELIRSGQLHRTYWHYMTAGYVNQRPVAAVPGRTSGFGETTRHDLLRDEQAGLITGYVAELPFTPEELMEIALTPPADGDERPSPNFALTMLILRLDRPGFEDALFKALGSNEQGEKLRENRDLLHRLNFCPTVTLRNRIASILLESAKPEEAIHYLSFMLERPDPIARHTAVRWLDALPSERDSEEIPSLFARLLEEDTPESRVVLTWLDGQKPRWMRENILRGIQKRTPLERSDPIFVQLVRTLKTDPVATLRVIAFETLLNRFTLTADDGVDFLLGQTPFPPEVRREDIRTYALKITWLALGNRGTDEETKVRLVIRLFESLAPAVLAQFGASLLQASAEQDIVGPTYFEFLGRQLARLDLASADFVTTLDQSGLDVPVAALQVISSRHPRPLPDPWIRQCLESNHIGLTSRAFCLLDSEQAVRYRDEVRRALQHPNKDVRLQAIAANVQYLDAQAGKDIAQLLGDPVQDVRERALVRLQDLRAYLEEAERWSRVQAADGSLSPIQSLLRNLEGDDPAIAVQSIRSLGALGDPTVLPALVEQLRSEREDVRQAAQEAIDLIIELRQKDGKDGP